MGKKIDLNDADRSRNTSLLGNGMTTLKIRKIMGRDRRSINTFAFSWEKKAVKFSFEKLSEKRDGDESTYN